MKTRRIIYIILGILFFALNLLVTILDIGELRSVSADGYGVGVILGSQIWLYISLLFFYGSYRVSRKLKEKREREWETDIDSIGKE